MSKSRSLILVFMLLIMHDNVILLFSLNHVQITNFLQIKKGRENNNIHQSEFF